MRIIAGEFRRRLLASPPENASTRPIPDRVKESVFNLLRGHAEGANVFDGFAGTGAVGLEAVSRGAKRCVLVERDKAMAEVLRANIATLGVGDRCEVVVGDALGVGAVARAPRPLHLVFMDPPYPMMRDPLQSQMVKAQLARLVALLDETGYAVLRTPWPCFLDQQAAEASHPPRKGMGKGKGKRGRRDHAFDAEERGRGRRGTPRARGQFEPVDEDGLEEWEELTQDEIEDALAGEAGEDADGVGGGVGGGGGGGVRPAHVPLDLKVEGAKGPETHVYGSMAVHLYMRDMGGAVGAVPATAKDR